MHFFREIIGARWPYPVIWDHRLLPTTQEASATENNADKTATNVTSKTATSGAAADKSATADDKLVNATTESAEKIDTIDLNEKCEAEENSDFLVSKV